MCLLAHKIQGAGSGHVGRWELCQISVSETLRSLGSWSLEGGHDRLLWGWDRDQRPEEELSCCIWVHLGVWIGRAGVATETITQVIVSTDGRLSVNGHRGSYP